MSLSDDELKGYEDFARLNMAGAVSTGLIPIPTHHLLALITEVWELRRERDEALSRYATSHVGCDAGTKARDLLGKLKKGE